MNASVGFRWRAIFGAAWVLLILCAGCSLKVQKKALYEPDELAAQQGLDGRSPWLKAHLPDGGLYLLSDWRVNEERREIVGVGTRLNARREVLDNGPFAVALDSVSIFESNTVQTSSAVAGLTVLTG